MSSFNVPSKFEAFEEWIEKSKCTLQERNFKIDRSLSVAETMLQYYLSPKEYFVGELTGYDCSSKGEVCAILFFATDDKQYSLSKAKEIAQDLYAKRTVHYQDAVAKQLQNAQ